MTSPWEFTAAQAAYVAAAYQLGDLEAVSGLTGRGELGFVFRLTTSFGTWAVKRLIEPQLEVDVREDVEFVAAARATGVPTPAMVTTAAGAVLLELPLPPTADGVPGSLVTAAQVRAYQWVDLADIDPFLDAGAVAAALGALHRTEFRGTRGEHPWYREPVGAARWDGLVTALAAAGAPFADDLVSLRSEFLALEQVLVDPHDLRTCHRDLFPENVRGVADGSVCVIDWDNHGEAGASKELAFVLWGFAGGRADRARQIVDSYAGAGGTGRVRSPGDFTMLIATLGHINERAQRFSRPSAKAVGRRPERRDNGRSPAPPRQVVLGSSNRPGRRRCSRCRSIGSGRQASVSAGRRFPFPGGGWTGLLRSMWGPLSPLRAENSTGTRPAQDVCHAAHGRGGVRDLPGRRHRGSPGLGLGVDVLVFQRLGVRTKL